jgi:hypothetical protein
LQHTIVAGVGDIHVAVGIHTDAAAARAEILQRAEIARRRGAAADIAACGREAAILPEHIISSFVARMPRCALHPAARQRVQIYYYAIIE